MRYGGALHALPVCSRVCEAGYALLKAGRLFLAALDLNVHGHHAFRLVLTSERAAPFVSRCSRESAVSKVPRSMTRCVFISVSISIGCAMSSAYMERSVCTLRGTSWDRSGVCTDSVRCRLRGVLSV